MQYFLNCMCSPSSFHSNTFFNFSGIQEVRANILHHKVNNQILSAREEEVLAQGANWEHDAGTAVLS